MTPIIDTDLPALIFDCDGVLIDSEMLASRVEAEVTRTFGLRLTTEEAHDLFLGKTIDSVAEVIASKTGKIPSTGWIYNWGFATAHAFMRELKAIEGIGDALRELRRRGHRMCVASQSPIDRVRLSLGVVGFAEYFGNHVYVTSMVSRPKPAPDIYLLAAEKLGVAPASCVVIEDSPAGAAAARAAGMRVIGYAPGDTAQNMRAAGAEVIASMRDLVATIDRAR